MKAPLAFDLIYCPIYSETLFVSIYAMRWWGGSGGGDGANYQTRTTTQAVLRRESWTV